MRRSRENAAKSRGNEKRLKSNRALQALLKRPHVTLADIMETANWKDELTYYEKTQAEVAVKYEGYIKRELSSIGKFKKIEKIRIPESFDYSLVSGLSNEIKEKLNGSAEKGFSYSAENIGEYVLLKIKEL